MNSIKFSRSEQEEFRKCRRSAYYKYYHKGSGFESSVPSLPLILGTSVHSGMEWLFRVNVETAIKHAWQEWEKQIEGRPPFSEGKAFEKYSDFLEEQRWLMAALVYTWRIQFYEQFIKEYEVISVEREIETQVGSVNTDPSKPYDHQEQSIPIVLQSRCDMVVRSNLDGAIYIPDWKCVKDARDWHRKFQMESQTWAQMSAVGAHLNEPVAGAIYWALIKGGRTKDGRQSSNLIYGYRKPLSSGAYEYDPDYKSGKGWEKFPVWQVMEFGPDPLSRLKYWLNWLPYEVRAGNFCQSPPVGLDEQLANDWLRTSANNMVEIRSALGDNDPSMDFFYRSNSYFLCSKCPYKGPCLEGGDMDQMISEGMFRARVDHHLEAESEN